MDQQYKKAVELHNEAARKFAAVQTSYRARKISDAAYLMARAEYAAASAEFDKAFAIAAGWQQ
jgi:hypothetical protein